MFRNFNSKYLAAAMAVAVSMAATPLAAATYLFNWTGSGGYSMGGVFSFSDALLGTTIDESELDRLTFDVVLNGVSQGTADLIGPGAATNFNFDSATGTFLVGGNSSSTSGQLWNFLSSPVGFGSGSGSQAVSVGGSAFGFISVAGSTLTATRLPDPGVIPLPSGAVLLLAAFGGAGLITARGRGARRPASA